MIKPSSFLAIILLLSLSLSTQGQSRIYEKDLLGTWKLVMDIEGIMKEAKEEVDGEGILTQLFVGSVTGFVSNLAKNVGIYLDFQKNGIAKITINALGEVDTKEAPYVIDSKGRLIIEDAENFTTDRKGYWLMKDDKLLNYDSTDDGMEEHLYMIRVQQ